MNDPTDAKAGSQANEPGQPRGRYRFQGGRPLDPNAGVHPEMAMGQEGAPVSGGIPSSPQQLIDMQENNPSSSGHPKKPDRSEKLTAKVKQVLELIKELDTTAADDLEIALTLVRQLEEFHDKVVADMQDDPEANHGQIAAWSVDADRLMHCRIFLNSIDLD